MDLRDTLNKNLQFNENNKQSKNKKTKTKTKYRGRCRRDRMVVEFTITYANSAYHH